MMFRQLVSMDALEHFHTPSPIDEDSFEASKIKPLWHTLEDISTSITAHVEGDRSSRQLMIKDRFEFEGFWNFGNQENLQDLMRFFQFYDGTYFNDLLRDHCRIEVAKHSWPAKRAGGRTPTRKREPYVRVTITQDKTKGNIYERIQRCQTALLHQMLHAMFLLYTCICERGCAHKVRNDSAEDAHHIAWQAAAQAIEEVERAGGSILGFGTDMCRNRSMTNDMMLGYNLPGDAALRSVGLDIVEILKHRDEHRQVTARKNRLRVNTTALRNPSCLRNQWTMEGSYELHVPLPISEEGFELGRMKPLSYSLEAIAAEIREFNPYCTQFCKLEELAPREQKAVQRFRRHGTLNLGDPHNIEDIKNYLDIFNEGYFNGLLTGYRTMELVEAKDLVKRHGVVIDGYCNPFQPGRECDIRYKLEKPHIIISVRQQPGNMFIYDAIKSYHEIILHEMLHAIFDVYRCQCDNGCRQRMERENSGGHHPFDKQQPTLWNQPAGAAPTFGYSLPNEATLRPLHLDFELLFRKLKGYRAAKEEAISKDKSIYAPMRAGNSCIRNQCTVDSWDRSSGFDRSNWIQKYKNARRIQVMGQAQILGSRSIRMYQADGV
ncbi:uncharacterized protein PAC_07960 [Phialocephala subalpina]|uniref:SprT-like domain-containing protein n=1 Tax=Phialocephala subalpina TaxID=576137 RepID=A0A1L7WZ82_9HELO|nr:uncharacterized protein PAC_07960 [Phialocephala subalpina]